MSPKFFIYLAVVALLLATSAPSTEGTLFLTMCLLRSPLCPLTATTPLCRTGYAWNATSKLCVTTA